MNAEDAVMEEQRVLASDWGGGKSPFMVSWGKLMMWLFLISDALTFSGLLAAYGVMRMSAGRWPNQAEIFHVQTVVGPMTFILILSSVFMALAVAAARMGDHGKVRLFLGLTILGGLAFLGMQAFEWTNFIREGARLTSNPWQIPMFSTTFFVITGFHGSHVTSGVIYLAVVANKVARGNYNAETVEIAGLYWHFVDLVWVFIFTLLYLI